MCGFFSLLSQKFYTKGKRLDFNYFQKVFHHLISLYSFTFPQIHFPIVFCFPMFWMYKIYFDFSLLNNLNTQGTKANIYTVNLGHFKGERALASCPRPACDPIQGKVGRGSLSLLSLVSQHVLECRFPSLGSLWNPWYGDTLSMRFPALEVWWGWSSRTDSDQDATWCQYPVEGDLHFGQRQRCFSTKENSLIRNVFRLNYPPPTLY